MTSELQHTDEAMLQVRKREAGWGYKYVMRFGALPHKKHTSEMQNVKNLCGTSMHLASKGKGGKVKNKGGRAKGADALQAASEQRHLPRA